MGKAKRPIDELRSIMARLRGPAGCPWDRRQDHSSLRPFAVEEACELLEAIERGRSEEIREELGDVLLQIVFHSRIAEEEGRFDFDDVARGICEKLVRRHPHVFGDAEVPDEAEAQRSWERIKTETEGKRKLDRHRLTPILHRALRLQEKAVSFGFDWEDEAGLLDKLSEEIGEVRVALHSGNRREAAAEIGDLLFMVVNLARFVDIDPEEALENALLKFSRRFRFMERTAEKEGRSLRGMGLAEMERYWEKAKEEE